MRISDCSSDVCSSDLAWPANIRFFSIGPPCAISCNVFWMQKLRGSASRPVEFVSVSAHDENRHWLRQPMQSARSDERRVWKAWGSTDRFRRAKYHVKKKYKTIKILNEPYNEPK